MTNPCVKQLKQPLTTGTNLNVALCVPLCGKSVGLDADIVSKRMGKFSCWGCLQFSFVYNINDIHILGYQLNDDINDDLNPRYSDLKCFVSLVLYPLSWMNDAEI